jgi:hypothetical protein
VECSGWLETKMLRPGLGIAIMPSVNRSGSVLVVFKVLVRLMGCQTHLYKLRLKDWQASPWDRLSAYFADNADFGMGACGGPIVHIFN